MNQTKDHQRHNEVSFAVELIKPLLSGRDPQIQGAILAELLATLLAGHWIPGDPDQTRSLRASILATHCMFVRQLTEENAKIIGTDK